MAATILYITMVQSYTGKYEFLAVVLLPEAKAELSYTDLATCVQQLYGPVQKGARAYGQIQPTFRSTDK